MQAFINWRSDWGRPAASGVARVGVEGARLKGLVMARCFPKDSRCYCTQTWQLSRERSIALLAARADAQVTSLQFLFLWGLGGAPFCFVCVCVQVFHEVKGCTWNSRRTWHVIWVDCQLDAPTEFFSVGKIVVISGEKKKKQVWQVWEKALKFCILSLAVSWPCLRFRKRNRSVRTVSQCPSPL